MSTAIQPKSDARSKSSALPLTNNTSDLIRSTHTEELVIALCGPIGAPLHEVAEDLARILSEEYSYECQPVRLSKLIEDYCGSVAPTGEFERIQHLIAQGNLLRQKHGASVLADLAIREIARSRQRRQGNDTEPQRGARVCHIIDSIKNPEELDAFRLLYREVFFCIGVFASTAYRETTLTGKSMTRPQVHTLIDKDSGEEIDHGQSVRKAFPRADYFVRADGEGRDAVRRELKRFLTVLFRNEVTTPDAGESAMFHAASAAQSSACLSRQVGAALTDEAGEVLSVGWNEVPAFGGGAYPRGKSDNRCVKWQEKCHNDYEKRQIAELLAVRLVDEGLVEIANKKRLGELILKSRVGQLIEFSRAVHAEMHAILAGLRQAGARVARGRLYCTTYPCHSCARHAIAAGVSKVFFIEPYPKSLAMTLHADALSDTGTEVADKVQILPYQGVSPSRYLELFSMTGRPRKDSTGNLITLNKRTTIPANQVSLESLPTLEGLVVAKLSPDLANSDEEG
jgi:deoxycytidylate deaminase